MNYNLHVKDVPKWNIIPYVKYGYRSKGNYRQCLYSLFGWHNETLNVWSMILVNIFSLFCLIYVLIFIKPKQFWPFLLLYVSSLVHLPFSIGYHLFIPMSKDINTKWYKLDLSFIFIGITCLILSMCYFVLPIQYTILTITISIGITLYSFYHIWYECVEKCSKKKNAILVSIITSLLFIPIVFQLISNPRDYITLILAIGIVSSLVFGAICYSTSFFNKFTPSFNSSHTLMHIMVLIAHILEYIFVVRSQK